MPEGNISEINDKVDKLGNAWEEFKSVNEARLDELEKKGTADPLFTDQLNKINDAIDKQKSQLDALEKGVEKFDVALGRSANNGAEEGKSSEDELLLKNAMSSYLKKGHENGLQDLSGHKSLSVHSEPDGGYLVTPAASQEIIRVVNETTPMRQLASIETISTDSLDIMEDIGLPSAGWVGETTGRPDTDNAQLGTRNIPVHEMYASPKATQKLLDDASLNVEQWHAGKVAEQFTLLENTAFVKGDGVKKPRGILTYDAGTSFGQIEQIGSGAAEAVTADSFIQLYYALKEEYATRATFLMNRATVLAARLLKESTTGNYIWAPGLAAGEPDRLIGVPIVQGSDMPVVAANALSVAVGDFRRAYKIVDRIGIRVLRDPFTDKPFVKFYTTKRVGGDVTNFEAIKLMRIAAA